MRVKSANSITFFLYRRSSAFIGGFFFVLRMRTSHVLGTGVGCPHICSGEMMSGPFAPLHYRDFRLLFGGMLIGSLAMPMQWMAQTWLVLDLASKESEP